MGKSAMSMDDFPAHVWVPELRFGGPKVGNPKSSGSPL